MVKVQKAGGGVGPFELRSASSGGTYVGQRPEAPLERERRPRL